MLKTSFRYNILRNVTDFYNMNIKINILKYFQFFTDIIIQLFQKYFIFKTQFFLKGIGFFSLDFFMLQNF